MPQPTPPSTTSPNSAACAATVRLLLFGPVRARMGIDVIDLKCADDMTTSTLWSTLAERSPELAALRPIIRLARNGEFVGNNESIHPGDEIALIPPVSGG